MLDDELEVVDTTAEIVRMRVRGKDFPEIAEELGLVSAERAREKFLEHVRAAYAASSDEEMRFLQLKRLESMVDFLWDNIKDRGEDGLTDAKQTANLLKVIEEINSLMGLHRDPLVEAQVRLTEAQTDLLYQLMAGMRMEMLQRALDGLRPVTNDLTPEVSERVRVAVESGWATWYEEAVTVALESTADESE